jgi:trans-aconitate methyltransferase
MNSITTPSWDDTKGYELYVGRWSRFISKDFIYWLKPDAGLEWLEVGCGTGALTSAILEKANPKQITAIDKSGSYIKQAMSDIIADNVIFLERGFESLPSNETFDIITSGLVLNFLPDIKDSFQQMANKLKPAGQLSAFVWDYAGHYQPMRHFWDAAKEVSPIAQKFDAGVKFSICNEIKLTDLFQSAGLTNIRFTTLERIATFQSFDDYWLPIASAQGSVTEFMSSLNDPQTQKLKELLKQRLPIAINGEIKLIINALAIAGTRQEGKHISPKLRRREK